MFYNKLIFSMISGDSRAPRPFTVLDDGTGRDGEMHVVPVYGDSVCYPNKC